METHLSDFIRDAPDGAEADAILRRCVHCGFCNATCPTYQLLGDELDGPRGRIYQIKQVLEGSTPTAETRLHLDRCLTCRNCETTCPSGVEYGRLLDIGRRVVEERAPRPATERLIRKSIAGVLARTALFRTAVRLGRLARPLLPAGLAAKLPPPPTAPALRAGVTTTDGRRRMLVLRGCVQPALAPNINAAATRVLARLGIALTEADEAGCCGALRFHLNDQAGGLDDMRRNVDAWWPYVENGIETIVMTASGCGVTVREYGHLLRHDPDYAERAARIGAMTRDLSEVLLAERDQLKAALETSAGVATGGGPIAFHPPCSLQHGQKITGIVESLLQDAGYTLTPVTDSHLCCGSAGTYSLLQPDLATRLRDNKLAALNAGGPGVIASANIGCISHLQSGANIPVRHWIELLDDRLDAVRLGA